MQHSFSCTTVANYYPIFLVTPQVCLQLGQVWTISLSASMHSGIQQHRQQPIRNKTNTISHVSMPASCLTVVTTSFWQLGHRRRTGVSPKSDEIDVWGGTRTGWPAWYKGGGSPWVGGTRGGGGLNPFGGGWGGLCNNGFCSSMSTMSHFFLRFCSTSLRRV